MPKPNIDRQVARPTRFPSIARLVAWAITTLVATTVLGIGSAAPGAAQEIPVPTLDIEDPGTLTIWLESEPPDADLTLPFFVQGSSQAVPFGFSDFREMRPGDSWSLGGLPPGRYGATTPISVPNHKILGIDCAEADPTTGSAGRAGSRSASIGLDRGDHVDCVFTVAGPGDLRITVETEPAGGAPQGEDGFLDFAVQALEFGAVSNSVAAGSSWEIEELPAGDYLARVVDTQVKWKLVAVQCEETESQTPSDGDLSGRLARVGIDGGDVVTCTFTLGEPGDVNITLESDPESTDPVMPFFLTVGTTPGGLQDAELQAPWTWKLEAIPVGRHSVHTTATNGLFTWRMKDVSCTDGDPETASTGDTAAMRATIGMDPAEVVDCTFTVAGPGTVTVAVESDLPGATGSLSFYVEGRNQDIRPSKTVKVGKTWKIERLPADRYVSVALPDDRPGRELVRVACSDTDSTTPSSGDIAQRTGRHGLDPGEQVNCTFVIAGLPREGQWTAQNKKGRLSCAGIEGFPLKASTQSGTIKIRQGGKRFVASALFGPGKSITFDQDQDDPRRYVGKVPFETPVGKGNVTVTLDIKTARKIEGVLRGGVKTDFGTCAAKRKVTLTYAGG